MNKYLFRFGILFYFLSVVVCFSQTPDSSTSSIPKTDYVSPTEYVSSGTSSASSGVIFSPRVGLGVGTFSFYGDLYDKHFQPPMIGRIASEIYLTQEFDFLQVNLYTIFGKLGANERFSANGRNLNFESQIRVGGINATYNFTHFLPKNKNAYPFVSLGIENVEFLSKTDLTDRFGNVYNYWSDGTIRNLPETDPNAINSVILHRDYSFETDIRELNIDGFGKYTERTFAIPFGIGVGFKITDHWSCKLGTTMHFTFTDYLDGVTEKSIAGRTGNSKNDNFMMSSFSISYNFGSPAEETSESGVDYSGVDFLALDNDDADGDGVDDGKDACAGTPLNIKVDTVGCPYDDDGDGVINERDDELNSAKGAYVDAKGVTVPDSLIDLKYRKYSDSTNSFAETIYLNKDKNAAVRGVYTVQLGIFNKVDPELAKKFLSIKDVSTTKINDSTTVYAAGTYGAVNDAEARKNALIAAGYPDAKVVFKQNNQFKEPPKYLTSDNDSANQVKQIPVAEALASGTVLRVQLGAYKKRLSKNVFKGVPDLIEVETADGLYKYMTGSFKTFEEAAKHKTDMALKGYTGAFITAYKGGGRVTLVESGATPNKKGDKIAETPDNVPVNATDKKLLIYKVQIGIFKNDPPDDKLELFSKIPDVRGEKTASGITMYTVGAVNSYKQAEALRVKMATQYNFPDAFIIAYYNGAFISVQEAMELEK